MRSFRRVHSWEMPRQQYYAHIAIVATIGVVAVLVAGVCALWITLEGNLREAQQAGVHIQMALSRAGEYYMGKGQEFVTSDGMLSDDASAYVLSLANEDGSLADIEFDTETMQAISFTYYNAPYTVRYCAQGEPTWTVHSDLFCITKVY